MSRFIFKEDIDKVDKVLCYLMMITEVAKLISASLFLILICALAYYWDRFVLVASYVLNSTVCS